MLSQIKNIVLLAPIWETCNNERLTYPLKNKNDFAGCSFQTVTFLVILMILSFRGYSQQPTNITHYMFTGMAINPASAGSNDAISITGLIRQQWIGLKTNDGTDISPQIFFLSIDSPIKFLHGGIGASLMQDKIGPFTNIYLKLDYAYQADLGDGILSAGAQLDLVNMKKTRDFNPIDEDDGALAKDTKSDLTADAGIGIMYRVPDKYYVGLSVDQVLGSLEKKIFYQLKRTFNLHGGYDWVVPGHPNFELLPSALIRTDISSFSLDVTALVLYKKKFWGGLGYRYQDMASILAGLTIKGVKVGLSYDLGLSKLASYQSGGLEIMVNYCFQIKTEKFRKSYRNTRFL